jgi:hypothetical protein
MSSLGLPLSSVSGEAISTADDFIDAACAAHGKIVANKAQIAKTLLRKVFRMAISQQSHIILNASAWTPS